MDASEYENIARLEAQHWWYRGMAAISLSLLAPNPPALRILDAGCGPGGMLLRMKDLGQPIGVDFHPRAIAYAQKQLPTTIPLLRGSITDLPLTSNQFDLLVSFDVLYHRAVVDDGAALAEFWRVLKPGGRLLIRVPALEALRGAHDVMVHTRQRYERTELGAKLKTAGFQIQRLTYANSLLFPLILLRRKLQGQEPESESDVEMPSALVNRLLEAVLGVERLWLRWFDLPIGVSLFALASKPTSPT
jgi:ubiquinone/menaquinone biosynthesis C-methylase UbiE